jgi:hypothetical protein
MNIETIGLLNRLLAIHERSFIQYLAFARPYVPPGREELLEALEAMDHDQDVMAQRISHMIIDAGALPRTGEFPMEFTDLHDLSIDYLMQAAVRYDQFDIEAIQAIVDSLPTEPAAKAVAEEALGMAKGRLDTLRELVAPPKAAA